MQQELMDYLSRVMGYDVPGTVIRELTRIYPQVNGGTHLTFGLNLQQPYFIVPLQAYGISLNLEVKAMEIADTMRTAGYRMLCTAYEPVSDMLFVSVY